MHIFVRIPNFLLSFNILKFFVILSHIIFELFISIKSEISESQWNTFKSFLTSCFIIQKLKEEQSSKYCINSAKVNSKTAL